jgi:predicted DNA-binding protein (UPF0251 family)
MNIVSLREVEMPRPVKYRRVAEMPLATYFKPAGVPLRLLEEAILAVEEAEAIRLKDLLGLEQQECAEKMAVSRSTFHRILRAAHHKVATALINGQALRIEGGNFAMLSQLFRCQPHGHQWRVPFEAAVLSRALACPTCKTTEVLPIPPRGPGFGRGRGPGRRRGGGWRGGRG